MSKVLVYTSPARGHLYPLVPTLLELQRRGHKVALRTLSSELGRMRGLGFTAEGIAPQIEGREIDDWKAKSPPAALLAACRTFIDRGQHEISDLRDAIEQEIGLKLCERDQAGRDQISVKIIEQTTKASDMLITNHNTQRYNDKPYTSVQYIPSGIFDLLLFVTY